MKKFVIVLVGLFGLCGLSSTRAWAACGGDCDGDNEVTVNELIQGVNIALGIAPVDQCNSFDTNQDGEVTINEIVTAVNYALAACPAPVATPTATATATPGIVATPTPGIVPPGISAAMLGTWSGQAASIGGQKNVRIKIAVVNNTIVVTDLGGNLLPGSTTRTMTILAPTALNSTIRSGNKAEEFAIALTATENYLAGQLSTIVAAFPPQYDVWALTFPTHEP